MVRYLLVVCTLALADSVGIPEVTHNIASGSLLVHILPIYLIRDINNSNRGNARRKHPTGTM